MSRRLLVRAVVSVTFLSLLAGPLALLSAKDPPAKDQASEAAGQTASAVIPKPFSENTTKGLAYLIEQQDASGGWGQGGGWRTGNGGRVEGGDVKDPPDLGNTCIATLALIRSGSTPKEGPYAKNVARAVEFICERVEKADKDSMYVTDVRDTQLQSKIGQYVDTFLAGLVLSELKGKLPGHESEKRVVAALEKTIAKIEKNQQADGTFVGNTGWASVLSQALCSKALNRAAQNEVAVRADVLSRDFASSVAGLDKKTGEFKSAAAAASPTLVASISGPMPTGGEISARSGISGRASGAAAAPAMSDAGVSLYMAAGNTARISDQLNTGAEAEKHAKQVLADAKAPKSEQEKARAELDRVKDIRAANEAAVDGIVRKLDDKQFMAGFGNNGGEEFLSYMNISEALAAKGGPEWQTWDKSIAENLNRVQNKDGSWSGDHCITGRTFCTSAALLTLLADRAPVPLAAKIQNHN